MRIMHSTLRTLHEDLELYKGVIDLLRRGGYSTVVDKCIAQSRRNINRRKKVCSHEHSYLHEIYMCRNCDKVIGESI